MSKLNDRQILFCKEYLIDLNATQAAIRAGYSENTAAEIGHENLRKPHISSFIQTLQQEKSNELNISFTDILEIEWEIALESDRDGDRLKATEQISKKLGFYEKDNKQKEVSLNIISLGSGKKPE